MNQSSKRRTLTGKIGNTFIFIFKFLIFICYIQNIRTSCGRRRKHGIESLKKLFDLIYCAKMIIHLRVKLYVLKMSFEIDISIQWVFSSPELKAQVSFSDRLLSVVCLSVCPSVNFSHFQLLFQNHWTNFNQTWHKASLGGGDSIFFKCRATPSSKGR